MIIIEQLDLVIAARFAGQLRCHVHVHVCRKLDVTRRKHRVQSSITRDLWKTICAAIFASSLTCHKTHAVNYKLLNALEQATTCNQTFLLFVDSRMKHRRVRVHQIIPRHPSYQDVVGGNDFVILSQLLPI